MNRAAEKRLFISKFLTQPDSSNTARFSAMLSQKNSWMVLNESSNFKTFLNFLSVLQSSQKNTPSYIDFSTDILFSMKIL
jgi:hypothetical protein